MRLPTVAALACALLAIPLVSGHRPPRAARVVIVNDTGRVRHLDAEGAAWATESGDVGPIWLEEPPGLCPCGSRCTPRRHASVDLQAGERRVVDLNRAGYRVTHRGGEPCFVRHAAPSGAVWVHATRHAPAQRWTRQGPDLEFALSSGYPQADAGADEATLQRVGNTGLRSLRDREPGAQAWLVGCRAPSRVSGPGGAADTERAGRECSVSLEVSSDTWLLRVRPQARNGSPAEATVRVGAAGVVAGRIFVSGNTWATSSRTQLSVVGETTHARHTHGGASARLGHARFRVQNGTGRALPIRALSGEFVTNGGSRPLENISLSVSEIPRGESTFEVYFASHPAYQSWNQRFAARLRLRVGSATLTPQADYRVIRVEPLREP